MPPVLIGAGIAAAGAVGSSIIGGVMSSNASKKAAQTQQNVANQQIAANNANRDYITGLEQPNMDRGNWAGDIYSSLLGKGDATAGKAALDTWRGSVGYQDTLKTGLGAVNANAYARGMGDSGATLKALQERGMSLADQNQGVYMNNLSNLINTGNSAIGNIAGVSTQTTQNNNGALGNAADAQSNATLSNASTWNQVLKNLTNIGTQAAGGLGSSYGEHDAGNGAMIPQSNNLGLNPNYNWMR